MPDVPNTPGERAQRFKIRRDFPDILEQRIKQAEEAKPNSKDPKLMKAGDCY